MEKKRHFRTWWGLQTNKQKNDFKKKYFEGTDKCTPLEDHPMKGMTTYFVDETDENILIIARGENIDFTEDYF